MIQYAHKCHEVLYDKYILLSSACCPLYRIDVIYNDILYDDKSIMGIFSDVNGDLSQSQWMILDKKHVELFFGNFLTDMYGIDFSETECTRYSKSTNLRNLIVKSTDINKFYDEFDTCEQADEQFFVKFIAKKVNIDDEIRTITQKEIIEKIKSIPTRTLDALKEVTDASDVIQLAPITVGEVPYVFYVGKKYKIMINSSDIPTFIYPTSVIGVTMFTEYNPVNVLRNFNLFELDPIFVNSHSTPLDIQTYVLREIGKACEHLREQKIVSNFKDIFTEKYMMSTMSHPIEYSSYTLRTILNTCILLLNISCTFNNNTHIQRGWIISSKEVNSIRSILIVYLKIIVKEFGMENSEKILKEIKTYTQMFQNKFNPIIRELDTIFVSELDKVYKEMDTEILDKLLSKKFGTVITNDILLSALSNKSYFIRKCYDTCHIEKFSKILRDLDLTEPVIVPIEVYDFKEIDRNLELHGIAKFKSTNKSKKKSLSKTNSKKKSLSKTNSKKKSLSKTNTKKKSLSKTNSKKKSLSKKIIKLILSS